MDLSSLRQQAVFLSEYFISLQAPYFLRDKALLAYSLSLSSIIIAAIDSPSPVAQLLGILSVNWSLVNGTALSPTSIPNAAITHLLCYVAENLADEININRAIVNEINKKHPEYQVFPIAAIELLMPTIKGSIRPNVPDEATTCRYPNLSDTPLVDTIRTHILGREGRFLLPVKLLTNLDPSQDFPLRNPYVPDPNADETTTEFDVSLYYVNDEERARLIQHSTLTQAIDDAHQQYVLIANDQSTLLGQLRQLCKKLAINDAHGGEGSQQDAGTGAYAPILNFMNYYQEGLDDAARAIIPVRLKSEIKTLLEVASDPTKNIDATQNLQTCIGTRGERILEAMAGHEILLNSIGVGELQREEFLVKTKSYLEQTREELTHALLSNAYEGGHDKLGLTCRLLESLQLTFTVSSVQDLEILKALNAPEMTELLRDPQLCTQVIHEMGSLENLVIFIMELSLEKIAAFFSVINQEQILKFICSPKDLGSLLMSITKEKCAVICHAIKRELIGIIQSGVAFNNVLKHLNPEQRTVIYEEMKNEWPRMIKTSTDFNAVLHYLNEEERTSVVEVMKNELPNIIHTGDDFAYVLAYLSPEYRTMLHDRMKGEWSRLIQTINDIKGVLFYLSPSQCTGVIKCLKGKLIGIVETGDDFNFVLMSLLNEQRVAIIEAMISEFPKIIQTCDDFTAALQELSLNQCMAVIEGIKSTVIRMIRTGRDFGVVLRELSLEQSNALIDVMGSLILDLEDLYDSQELTFHVELNSMIVFIKNTNKIEAVKRFASAIMDNEKAVIKTSLTSLVQITMRLKASDASFWTVKDPIESLVESLNALAPKWNDRIKSALGLSDEFPIMKNTVCRLITDYNGASCDDAAKAR